MSLVVKKNLQIAIDGNIGVGKSTLAFRLAQRLGLTYIYTGVMYRAVAYLALRNDISYADEKNLLKLLNQSQIELKPSAKDYRYCDLYLNGTDITHHLFTKETTYGSAQVAKLPLVRAYLVKLQQQLADQKSVVMDGRDIGSKVLPRADLKVYLTADLAVRAKRRWWQLKEVGKDRPYEEVLKSVQERDYEDVHRLASPLQKLPDAVAIDTTNLTIAQTVKAVIDILKKKKLVK